MADEAQPDDSKPTPERQAKLRHAYDKNVAAGKAPYDGEEIHTRGELRWVMDERRWSSEPEQVHANLSGADCSRADLSGTDLTGANLRGTSLFKANLKGAILFLADLSGTNLFQADLRGADLRIARLDAATNAAEIILDPTMRLGDVVWNGALLTQVDWGKAPHLGDDLLIPEAKTPADRLKAVYTAARAYRGLAVTLRGQGLVMFASGYRLREQRLERQALRLERKYLAWAFSGLLDLVAGYGERPGRAFWAYVTVVVAFTAAYFGVARLDSSLSHVAWYDWPALSITSFHGRGFFPGTLPQSGWVTLLALVEAVIGLFLELVFIATFSRRFLGN